MHLQGHSGIPPALCDVFSGIRPVAFKLAVLEVEYDCLPPFEGRATTRPNRIGMIFSGYPSVTLEQDGKLYHAAVVPGSLCVVNADPT